MGGEGGSGRLGFFMVVFFSFGGRRGFLGMLIKVRTVVMFRVIAVKM